MGVGVRAFHFSMTEATSGTLNLNLRFVAVQILQTLFPPPFFLLLTIQNSMILPQTRRFTAGNILLFVLIYKFL